MRSIIKAVIRVLIVMMSLDLLILLLRYITGAIEVSRFGREGVLYQGINSAVIAVFGGLLVYFLWRKTDRIVKLIAGDLNENELVVHTSNGELIRVAMCVLGVYLFVTAVPDLVGLAAFHVYRREAVAGLGPGIEIQQQAMETREWVAKMVTMLLAVWLVTGSKGFVRFLGYIWNLGETTGGSDKGK